MKNKILSLESLENQMCSIAAVLYMERMYVMSDDYIIQVFKFFLIENEVILQHLVHYM